jgi:hypothetical protein
MLLCASLPLWCTCVQPWLPVVLSSLACMHGMHACIPCAPGPHLVIRCASWHAHELLPHSCCCCCDAAAAPAPLSCASCCCCCLSSAAAARSLIGSCLVSYASLARELHQAARLSRAWVLGCCWHPQHPAPNWFLAPVREKSRCLRLRCSKVKLNLRCARELTALVAGCEVKVPRWGLRRRLAATDKLSNPLNL